MYRNKILFFLILAVIIRWAPAQSFRFAWLSDTHVSPTTTGAKDLSAAVKDINRQKGIHFVIVSGDITDTNFDDHLLHAKHILDSLNVPYYIIPGNHDSKWSGVGLANFKAFWGNDKFTFDYGPFKFIGLHQGPMLSMADGHFSPDDLEWLKNILHHLKNRQQPLIFVFHYPLYPPFAIDNYDAFLDVVKGYNVKLILNGHGHRDKASIAYGIPQIMDRSTLRKNHPCGGYNIVDYKDSTFYFTKRLSCDSTVGIWDSVSMKPRYTINEKSILRPDYSVNDSFPQVRVVWKKNIKHLITSSPVEFNHKIYLGNIHGNMQCFNLEDGHILWNFKTGKSIFATAAISPNGLVFTSTDSTIYCLNPSNRKLKWKLKTKRPNLSIPIIRNDTVFVGSSEGIFRAINLKNGTVIWQQPHIHGFVEARPLLYGNKVIFGTWADTLYTLNRQTGDIIWKWQGGRPYALFSPAACWPVASQGKIFIVAPDRYMTAIDAKTGKTIWRTNRYKVRETIGISANGQRVYAKCMRDTVFAVNPSSPKPDYLWIKNFKYGYEFANSMIEEKDGIAYFGTKNGLIIAFKGQNGQLLWKHKIDNSFVNTVLPLDNKQIVVATMDGRIQLLQW